MLFQSSALCAHLILATSVWMSTIVSRPAARGMRATIPSAQVTPLLQMTGDQLHLELVPCLPEEQGQCNLEAEDVEEVESTLLRMDPSFLLFEVGGRVRDRTSTEITF